MSRGDLNSLILCRLCGVLSLLCGAGAAVGTGFKSRRLHQLLFHRGPGKARKSLMYGLFLCLVDALGTPGCPWRQGKYRGVLPGYVDGSVPGYPYCTPACCAATFTSNVM